MADAHCRGDWHRGRGGVVRDGADTFLIRDGRIQIMTIHYTVERKAAESRGL
jgi:hypothetical protein